MSDFTSELRKPLCREVRCIGERYAAATEIERLQARAELLERVADAAEKCKDGCRRCDSFARYDELKQALAAL